MSAPFHNQSLSMNLCPLSTFSTCLSLSQSSIKGGRSHQIPVTQHEPPPLSKISHSARISGPLSTYIQYMSVSVLQSSITGGRSYQMSVTQYESLPLFYIYYKSVTPSSVKGGRSHQMSVTKYGALPLLNIQYKSAFLDAEQF